jgi:hypothetical protein
MSQAVSNQPDSRYDFSSTVDASGQIWLLGGDTSSGIGSALTCCMRRWLTSNHMLQELAMTSGALTLPPCSGLGVFGAFAFRRSQPSLLCSLQDGRNNYCGRRSPPLWGSHCSCKLNMARPLLCSSLTLSWQSLENQFPSISQYSAVMDANGFMWVLDGYTNYNNQNPGPLNSVVAIVHGLLCMRVLSPLFSSANFCLSSQRARLPTTFGT